MRISSVEWFRYNADVFLLLQGPRIFVSTPLDFRRRISRARHDAREYVKRREVIAAEWFRDGER
jgi:hypothetical protein